MRTQIVADGGVLIAVPPGESRAQVVAAGVARVATFALRTGLALLLAISGIGAGTLIAGDGSLLLIAEGVLIIAAAVLCLVRVQLAVRVFTARYAVCALIVLFCGLGALEHGLQPAYSSVLLALVWISAVVDSPRFVGVCVLLAWGGYTMDLALEGHALQVQHGSVLSQSVGELAILLVSAGLTFAAISLLRATLAHAPAGLAEARAGSIDTITPALAAAVRGEPIAELARGDPVAITATLSVAERAVLSLLARGLAPKQAARELGVELSTVRSHIASAKRKTGARTLDQLVGLFVEAQREQ